MLTRFRNEPGAARKFAHPNIVVMCDFGEQNGTLYLVMELLKRMLLEKISR
jgi:serine/threonine protein kinase